MSVAEQASRPRTVGIIGGGWAGCAAAVELAHRGHHVTMYEAARVLGGRARGVEVDGMMLDNGQHILLGAYTETIRLLQATGLQPDTLFRRERLQMRYPAASGGMDLHAPGLPAPWHLLVGIFRARGLSSADKLALARFASTARWIDWTLDADCTVDELLDRYGQTDRLIRLLWRPLCIAALNTPTGRASAKVFLKVLGDSIGAGRAASDMLLPRVDLTSLFPARAREAVERRGGVVHTGARVERLLKTEDGWLICPGGSKAGAEASFDAVIVAASPGAASALLRDWTDTSELDAFSYEAITTCYLRYERGVRLPAPFMALVDDSRAGHWGQFVFDRSQLDARQDGLWSVVVSAATDAAAVGQDTLARAIAGQLATVLRRPELAYPGWTKVISEKRATFSCTPGLARPANRTSADGLLIAGDYTASDYPATLESAVRSGVAAARLAEGVRP